MKKKISMLLCCYLLALTTAVSVALPSNAAEVTDEISETVNEVQQSGETKTYKDFEYEIITSEFNERYSKYDSWTDDDSIVGTVAVTNYLGTDVNVTIPDTIENKKVTVIKTCWGTSFVTYENGYSSTKTNSNTSLRIKNLTIPNSVKFITGVGHISPNGTSMSSSYGMLSEITDLNIPNSVTAIGRNAFTRLESLTSISIPENVTSISDGAIGDCTSLISIDVDSKNPNYRSVDGVLFNIDKTKLIKFPDNKSGEYTIPDSVTEIVSYAFENCMNLTSILVDDDNEIYCSVDGVLLNKDKTEIIKIPNGKTGDYTIPESVIRGNFYNCPNLTSITVPDRFALRDSYNSNGCTSLQAINVSDNHPYYCSVDGVLFTKDKTQLIECPPAKSGNYIIPDGVMKTTSSAFYSCKNLESITVPASLIAFHNYRISLQYIRAFNGCTNLKSINVNNDNPSFSSVDGVLFNKDKTELLTYPAGKTEDYYIIPESVKDIAQDSFTLCPNLTGITVSKNVNYIRPGAFSGCSNLTSIYIPQSVTSIGYGKTNEYGDSSAGSSFYVSNLTIYGIPGSAAEEHCKKYDINFVNFNTLNLEDQIALFGSPVDTSSGTSLTITSSDDSTTQKYMATYDENTKKFVFDYTPKAKDKIIFTVVSKLTGETLKTVTHTFTQSEIVNNSKGLAVSVSGDINKGIDLDFVSNNNDKSNDTDTEKDKPKDTDTSKDSDKPKDTDSNKDSDKPKDTDTNKDSDKPKDTHTNKDSDKPKDTDTPKNIKYGDLDGDGKVTSADALLVLRASVNLEKFDAEKTKLADVDGDGAITSSDSLFILRNSVGLKDNGTLFK